MTTTQAVPAPAPVARAPRETCDSCGAPVDDRQRYCVACGAHQRRADDPAARFFAKARRPRTVVAASASDRRTVPVIVAAGLIALLPVAAGIGILVGRGAGSNDEALLEALKSQRVQVINGGGAATGATAATTGGTGAGAASDAKAAKKDTAEKDDPTKIETADKPAAKISTPGGTARRLTGTKPTKQDLEESKKAVDRINSAKGGDYVDSQRDLPDQIVIP